MLPDPAQTQEEPTDLPPLLVANPWMERGGAEAITAWTLQALQRDFRITFATAAGVDWVALNQAYGSAVDPQRIQVAVLETAARLTPEGKATIQQRAAFEKRLIEEVAPRFDRCMSAYNPLDFGRPAIQSIGDFTFSERMTKQLYSLGEEKFRPKSSLVRRVTNASGKNHADSTRILQNPYGQVIANSDWTADMLKWEYGLHDVPVIAPPHDSDGGTSDRVKNPRRFACMGRVSPEKRWEVVIRVLSDLRAAGYPLELTFLGVFDDSPYSNFIRSLIEPRHNWIFVPGFVSQGNKLNYLAEASFGIHACDNEAFGMAVAELAAHGCVPFVPASGGSREIVPMPELQFRDEQDAKVKIAALLQNEERAGDLRQILSKRVQRYQGAEFVERMRDLVVSFFESRYAVAGRRGAQLDYMTVD